MGLLIVVLAGLFVYNAISNQKATYVEQKGESTSFNLNTVNFQQYFEDCSREAIISANLDIGIDADKVPQYNTYIQNNIEGCLESFFTQLEGQGVAITRSKPQVNRETTDETIIIKIADEVTLKKDPDTYKFSDYVRSFPRTVYVKLDGLKDGDVLIPSAERNVLLIVPKDSKITTYDGNLVSQISVKTLPQNFDGYDNSKYVIGNVYDFSPEGTVFLEPIEMRMKFDVKDLPPNVGATDLTVGYFDKTGVWVAVETHILKDNTAVAMISHFSKYALVYQIGNTIVSNLEIKNYYNQVENYKLVKKGDIQYIVLEPKVKLSKQIDSTNVPLLDIEEKIETKNVNGYDVTWTKETYIPKGVYTLGNPSGANLKCNLGMIKAKEVFDPPVCCYYKENSDYLVEEKNDCEARKGEAITIDKIGEPESRGKCFDEEGDLYLKGYKGYECLGSKIENLKDGVVDINIPVDGDLKPAGITSLVIEVSPYTFVDANDPTKTETVDTCEVKLKSTDTGLDLKTRTIATENKPIIFAYGKLYDIITENGKPQIKVYDGEVIPKLLFDTKYGKAFQIESIKTTRTKPVTEDKDIKTTCNLKITIQSGSFDSSKDKIMCNPVPGNPDAVYQVEDRKNNKQLQATCKCSDQAKLKDCFYVFDTATADSSANIINYLCGTTDAPYYICPGFDSSDILYYCSEGKPVPVPNWRNNPEVIKEQIAEKCGGKCCQKNEQGITNGIEGNADELCNKVKCTQVK